MTNKRCHCQRAREIKTGLVRFNTAIWLLSCIGIRNCMLQLYIRFHYFNIITRSRYLLLLIIESTEFHVENPVYFIRTQNPAQKLELHHHHRAIKLEATTGFYSQQNSAVRMETSGCRISINN